MWLSLLKEKEGETEGERERIKPQRRTTKKDKVKAVFLLKQK
jgi:hypothetical protein